MRNAESATTNDPFPVVPEQDAAWQILVAMAEPIRHRRRSRPDDVFAVILKLCGQRALTVQQLAELTGRSMHSLRIRYLTPLTTMGKLTLRFPDRPTHPHQAYSTTTRTS